MKRSRIFLFAFVLFMLILFYFMWDISRKTTPPWKKNKDSEQVDSAFIGS